MCAQTYDAGGGALTFTCQHGEDECVANKIHSCAIELVKGPRDVIELLSCMLQIATEQKSTPEIGREVPILSRVFYRFSAAKVIIHIDRSQRILQCARQFNVDWDEIDQCYQGTRGSELLRDNGKLTRELMPDLTFVPTIVINNVTPLNNLP